ncbi:MAG: MFS transporter, partial [Dehalococcoidales bacterium]
AMTNWFVRKRGLALGIRWAFSGVLVLPLITWLISNQGWRAACVIGGVVMLVVGWTLTWFFVRQHRPEHYGLLPDGARIDDADGADAGQLIDRGVEYAADFHEIEFTLRQAMRTPAYWLMLAGLAMHGTALTSLLTHLIPLLTDMGIDPTAAAAMTMIAGMTSIASRFGTGVLADRVGKSSLRMIMVAAYALQAGGIALFATNPTESVIYPFLILFYVGMGATMILTSILGGRYFGRKAFGSIRGSTAIISMPIAMLGPVYAGWVYDSTGGYIPALTLFAWLLGAAAVLMFFARPPKAPRQITGISDIV